MSPAEIKGAAMLTILALIGVFVGNLIRYGISGCLRRRAERQLRRSARNRAIAKWWDWFSPVALPKFREFHSEELEAVGLRASLDPAGMLEIGEGSR